MERFAQYWDDFDDLIGMVGLCTERIRRMALFVVAILLFLAFVLGVILVALIDPPLALAVATILAIQLTYRTVTETPSRHAAA
ncbi:MAG: hypothetical protein OER97_00315 [Gammaproteobacteria bacterium]|nr:hypothetical protein [Gammaproteobacteria bacterium]